MNQDFIFDANAKLSALENQRSAAQNECVSLVAELRKAAAAVQALEAEVASSESLFFQAYIPDPFAAAAIWAIGKGSPQTGDVNFNIINTESGAQTITVTYMITALD